MNAQRTSLIYKIVCLLIIGFVVAIRIHLAGIPFERDEGEYAYAGQLLNRGIPPYQEVYNMKFPGVYFMYALSFNLFGESVFAPRYLILLLQLVASAFIFGLARRLLQTHAAWLSAAMFMLFNLTLALQGLQANAEHFLVACLVPSLYLLYRGLETDSLPQIFASGILLACACLMKQHAFIFTLATLPWLLYVKKGKSFNHILFYGLGGLLPVLLTGIYLWHAGVWHRFYFLTIQYAHEYVGLAPFHSGLHQPAPTTEAGSNISPILVWFTGFSLIALLLPSLSRNTKFFLLLLLTASAISITPGFYFRRHYFLMLIPVFALLFAASTFSVAQYVTEKGRGAFVSVFVLLNALFFLWYQQDCFFKLPAAAVTERIYPGTPFSIAPHIASFIKNHSNADDRICMVGVEPELFFLSQRRSASGYIYTYPLLENQKFAATMTDEFIRQSEKYRPAVLVYSSHSIFDDGYRADGKLYDWFNTTYKANYKLIAICRPDNDYRLTTLDTVHLEDTLPLLMPQVRVYARISQ